jgi:outer membrane lipoprotein-sorting protein
LLKALTQPLVATGHIWFQAPDRFRWELGSPPQTIALGDATQMVVLYPRLKRAERYPLTSRTPAQWRQALALLEAGFPRRRSDLDSRFRLLSLTQTNAAWHLVLEPKGGLARQLVNRLSVDVATHGFSLRRTELVFADGSRLRNDFTHPVLNRTLDEKLFEWTPRPDFKITEPFTP